MDSRQAQFQNRIKELEAELVRVRHESERLRHENALLRQKIDLLSRRLFGKSSEQLTPGQLELVLEIAAAGDKDEAPEEPEPEPSKPRSRRRKPRLPDDLPVVEEVVDPERSRPRRISGDGSARRSASSLTTNPPGSSSAV